MSGSDSVHVTISHDYGSARNVGDNIESGPESLFEEATAPREFPGPAGGIEMDTRESDITKKNNGGTVVVETVTSNNEV
ncbi:hypothetical protein TWF281_001299 [Arthrobotrys megalospora]